MITGSLALRSFVLGLAIGTAVLSVPTIADQPPTIPRIGILNVTSEELLRQALREHGYIEGKNITIEWRRSQGSERELQSLAADRSRLA